MNVDTSVPAAALIRRVLGSDYVEFCIVRLSVDEDLKTGHCSVKALLSSGDNIEGQGPTLAAALLNGFVERYASEYPVLRAAQIMRYTVKSERPDQPGRSAVTVVSLEVHEPYGNNDFDFQARAPSCLAASGHAVTAVAEYFINAERTFILLRKCLANACERDRLDLVNRFTSEVVELVRNVSFVRPAD